MTLEIAVTLKAAMAANRPSPSHGADTGREPGPEAASDGPLNHEHIHRPDGRGHHHANADPGKHELKGREDDLRAQLQGQVLFAHRGWHRAGAAWHGDRAELDLRSSADLRD